MKLAEVNRNPTDRQLRQFGIISLFALPALGWLWSGGNLTVASWLGGAGIVLAILGLVYPRALKRVFVGLTIAVIPIGVVVGEAAMILIYFGVFLPIGILLRIARRDNLRLKLDRRATTYWQEKDQSADVASYYRQS